MKHQALKRPTSQKTPLSTSGLQRQAVRKVSEEELQTLSATQDRGFAQDFSQIPASTAGMPFQAKLSVGAAGDKYEQEADQVAAAVVDQLHSPTSDSGTNQQFVQREDAEEEELQMKPDSLQREDAEEEELQMKSDSVQREDAEEEELQMKSDSVQREDA
ncbi:MAG: hypothetical protein SAJ72_15970, partial [Jaaginema sp. PMC 1080.18]|nr:hypothetical protein [Jaaginema sp. PMC 1080.18]